MITKTKSPIRYFNIKKQTQKLDKESNKGTLNVLDKKSTATVVAVQRKAMWRVVWCPNLDLKY